MTVGLEPDITPGLVSEAPNLSDVGLTALMQGRVEDAIAILSQAIASEPGDFQSYNWLGIAFSRKGLYESALKAFSCAVILWPHSACYWYNLGTAHEACGELLRAARSYQIALSISPEYEQAQKALDVLKAGHPFLQSVELGAALTEGARMEALEELCIRDVQSDPWSLDSLDTEPEPRWDMLVRAADDGPLSTGILQEVAARLPHSIHGKGSGFPGFPSRITAALIDGIVVEVLWLAVVIVLNIIQLAIPRLAPLPNAIPIGLGLLAAWAYVVTSTARGGQTIGKRFMSLRVVDQRGLQPDLRQSAVRATSMVVNVLTAGLAYFWIGLDRRHQALHDKLSGTYVTGRSVDRGSALISSVGLIAVNLYVANFLKVQLF